jgi:hypothetical protein
MAAELQADASQAEKSPLPQLRWRISTPSILYCGHDLPTSERVAAFDLDGTLVDWRPGMRFSLEPDSWVWFNARVPTTLSRCAHSAHVNAYDHFCAS